MIKVLTKTRELINAHFNSLFNETEFLLPANVFIETVYKISDGNQNHVRNITFLISEDGQCCDYFLETNNYSSHQRLSFDGRVMPLENYEGQFGWPVFKDEKKTKVEHKRIMKHNESVQEVLLAKKFINKTGG